MKYLIIGAGIAGATAAETIRENDKDGEIVLLSGEPELVYNRVLLPSYVKGKIAREKLFMATPESLSERNIIVKSGVWAKSIDTKTRTVVLEVDKNRHAEPMTSVRAGLVSEPALNLIQGSRNEFGMTVKFDELLIATGGRPREWEVAGADKRGVFHFQTIADADAMLEYLLKEIPSFSRACPERREERGKACPALDAGGGSEGGEPPLNPPLESTPNPLGADLGTPGKGGRRAAIVGGGFIGLEFIEALTYRQIKTHLFLRGPYYWPEIMDEEQSLRLVRKLEELGVVIHRNETISEVIGDNSVSAIRTQSGLEVEVDFVGYGIGLEHNLEFLQGSGIKTNRGVIVNEYLESSVAGIFAAGDVAEFYDIILGKTQLVGNWDNAKKQGRIAGLNMAGAKAAYREVTFYSMSVAGLFLAMLGNAAASEADETIVRKNEAEYVKIFLSQNRVVGAAFVGAARDVMAIKKLISGQVILDDKKKEVLRDTENVIPADTHCHPEPLVSLSSRPTRIR